LNHQEFIRKWSAVNLKERSAAQEHFIDLCRLLGQKTPAEADPEGSSYTFEKGATKYDGGDGFADVWMRGHFAWEYKGKRKDLGAAYEQLLRYRESLDNPPLLVVCDMQRFEIHTNFTGTTKQVHRFELEDLAKEDARKILLALFTDPESLRPGLRIEQVTEEAAQDFASLAVRLQDRGVDPKVAAHFLNRVLFCLFAEDVGLLPAKLFQAILDAGSRDPREFSEMLGGLFEAMAKGGRFGVERIHFFNGGLFADGEVVPLDAEEIRLLRRIASFNWGQIEPAIFGTLFERGLDPAKRSQLGAHYTDRGSILRVVEPVLMAPLRREWAKIAVGVGELLDKAKGAKSAAAETKFRNQARDAIQTFRTDVLDRTQVLDPACGSGNFLYVALGLLHDLEKEVLTRLAEVEHGQFSLDIRVGPHMVHGIELNAYAHQLAQVTIWIGHFQWQIQNGFSFDTNPVLKRIETIECRDAILDLTDPAVPREAEWPDATVVVGNPPFLGDKRMLSELGESYVRSLRALFDGRLPGGTDLCTYWFEKARTAIASGRLKRAGLLATNSIRGGQNRRVLERIRESGSIFMAWSDEPWIVEGAAVRISLVGFDDGAEPDRTLDGTAVAVIHADLTGATSEGSAVDLTKARRLRENVGLAFQGPVKVGAFDIPGDLAREWLRLPANPGDRPNRHVVRPWANGMDLTRRPSDTWIVDFGVDRCEEEAALYEAPFEHVKKTVKPSRDMNRDAWRRTNWWKHGRSGEDLRVAVDRLARFIATPRVSKHRLFVWLDTTVFPDSAVVAIASDEDHVFGILHSRFHELWSLRLGTSLEDRPRYTPSTTFEPFPFPEGTLPRRTAERPPLSPTVAAIAEAARALCRLRDEWLNPPELVRLEPEVASDLRDRIVPRDERAAAELKKRTLTRLYNERPTWLVNAHAALDVAVAAAYGWPADLDDEEILRRLFLLNQEREPA
jgi:type II restriction/modification system DNA methylase subunit YeeA